MWNYLIAISLNLDIKILIKVRVSLIDSFQRNIVSDRRAETLV